MTTAVKVKRDRGLFYNVNTGEQFAAYQWRGTLDSLYDIAVWMEAMPFIAVLPGKAKYSLILPDKREIGEASGQKLEYEISKIADKGDWICWHDFKYRVVAADRFKRDYKPIGRPF